MGGGAWSCRGLPGKPRGEEAAEEGAEQVNLNKKKFYLNKKKLSKFQLF